MSTRFSLGLVLGAATLGLVFASLSTLDFVAHLDRQVHDLHCSFVPGMVVTGEASHGCQVTLLSPYSSVLRTSLWGGIPISLPAMAVFAFILYRGVDAWDRPPPQMRPRALILLAATAVPVLASLVMGTIAFTELHAACKLCIGIYIASSLCLLGAFLLWRDCRFIAEEPPAPSEAQASTLWLIAVAQGLGFVALPVMTYAVLAPDFSKFVGSCGTLAQPDDPNDVMLQPATHPSSSGVPTIELLDPLCPSCRGLEERLAASGVADALSRKVVLFPLDSACNWMLQDPLHPGACTVSEALLCADENPSVAVSDVLQWAFTEQEAIVSATKTDPDAAARLTKAQFPAIASCIGSNKARARLNKSLRWAVANEVPVMTPQVFVAGHKVCAEDTDLGLDWTLHQLVERYRSGALKPASTDKEPSSP